jgi:multidrug efflux pump subunit AcrA (membrane-fusion protein)
MKRETDIIRVMRWRWFAAAGSAIVLAVAFFAYRRPHVVPPKPSLVVQAVVPQVPTELTLAGKIQATRVVNVGAPVDGNIEQLLAAVGDDVSEGEVLARIKNPKMEAAQQEARLDAERARAHVSEVEPALIGARLEVSRSEADLMRVKLELAKAEKEYARQQMMMREGVTPRLVFERAEQEYNSLKMQSESLAEVSKSAAERVVSLTKELESARQTYDKTASGLAQAQAEPAAGEVNSTADGVVIARRGETGEPITKAVTDMFRIAVDLGTLQIVASADAQSAPRIHAGQAAAIEIKEIPGTAQGTVREVKAGQVIIDFKSPALTVRPGMTAQVRIKLT